jgi:hypothetical protein
MTEAPLMNDAAARSPTGEILDQATPTPPSTPPADTTTTPSPTSTPDASAPNATPLAEAPNPPSAPTAVPDKYEFTAPEGLTLDPAAVEAATPILKELGLSQEAAQKLITFQLQREAALLKSPADAVTAMRTDWQAKVKADPDMAKAASGGKTGIDAVAVDIARLKAALPADLRAEFSDAMNLTGAGDHPAIVKAMWKLAQFVTEGTHVSGKGPSELGQTRPGTSTKPTPAQALYPNLPS